MIDKDVILAKVTVVQRCLQRIRDVTDLDPEKLNNFDVQDIFVLNLQRAIQAVVDIASHVIAMEGWGVPETFRHHFNILTDKGIMNDKLRYKLSGMVGFRNIAVHDYQAIDISILQSILTTNLKDLEDFYSVVVNHYKL